MMTRLRYFLTLALPVVVVLVSFAALAQEQTQEAAAAPAQASGVLGPAETLTGKILMVVPDKDLLIVESDRGVPYNFVIRRSTRITAGGERLKLADLQNRVGEKVSVRFVPTRNGNIARSVEVG